MGGEEDGTKYLKDEGSAETEIDYPSQMPQKR